MSTSFALANDESSSNVEVLTGFIPLVCITEAIGLLAEALILLWIFKYNNGLGTNIKNEFNWHPFYMSLGFIYLMGNAILIFRMVREWPKKRIKVMHASLHGVVLILVAIALIAVIDSHNKRGMANFYTVHSWIGLVTLTFFCIQLCLGFSAFLYPGLDHSIRSSILPYHVFFGNVIFVLATGAAVIGIHETAFFEVQLTPRLILNSASIFFVIFGILVVYMTTKSSYQRYPRPGDATSSEINPPQLG